MFRPLWLIIVTVAFCSSPVHGTLRIICPKTGLPLVLQFSGPLLTYRSLRDWLIQEELWLHPDIIDFELATIADLHNLPIEFYAELATRQQFEQIWQVQGFATENQDIHIKAIREWAELFVPRNVPRQNSIPTGGSWAMEFSFERLERRRPQSWRTTLGHGKQSRSLGSSSSASGSADDNNGSSQNKRDSENNRSDELFHFEDK